MRVDQRGLQSEARRIRERVAAAAAAAAAARTILSGRLIVCHSTGPNKRKFGIRVNMFIHQNKYGYTLCQKIPSFFGIGERYSRNCNISAEYALGGYTAREMKKISNP